MSDYNDNNTMFDEMQGDIVELNDREFTNAPEHYSYISQDTHPEIPTGTYPCVFSGWMFTIKYNNRIVEWNSKNGGIRGTAHTTLFVDNTGRAYIIVI